MNKKSSSKRKSSRKKKTIYYKTKQSKKIYRLNINKHKYNLQNCKIITKKPKNNKNEFETLLNMYKIKNLKKRQFNIYPYCSEKVKLSKHIDFVNRYSINKNLLDIIENKYSCNFIKDNKFIKTKGVYLIGQENDPKKFLEYIFQNLDNKNHFIISHSHYMRKLTKYIVNTKSLYKKENKTTKNKRKYYLYDNLDILQIVIDTSNTNYKIKYCIIRRFSEKYKLFNTYGLGLDKTISNENTKSVFIMRHCVGCHNITKNPFKKLNYGYGLYSACFDEINNELKQVSKELKKIIKDYGGIKTFNFGSSIIFRAILTILIVYNSIK